MILQLGEIRPGLVAFLDPEILSDYGGECLAHPECRIQGRHHFVCLSVERHVSVWSALTSKPSIKRLEIVAAEKYGFVAWVKSPTFVVHPLQTWFAENYAFVEASGSEHSQPGYRNGVTASCVERLAAHCRVPDPTQLRLCMNSLLLADGQVPSGLKPLNIDARESPSSS